MGNIGIVGAGTAGLHLALLLQQGGLEPTLYAERTSDEVRGGRLPNTVAHNYRTRARDRALGVNHWDESARQIHGHWHYIPTEPPLDFPGYFTNPSISVDYRLYHATMLEDFEERGGSVVVGPIGADDLRTLAGRHDLVIVSTGSRAFHDVFPVLPDRSPYDQPQRLLAAGLFNGVTYPDDKHYVTISITPGQGEVIEIPMQSFEGNVTVLLFECVPGGGLEELNATAYDDDPKAYERLVLEKLRAFSPPVFNRVDEGEFSVTEPRNFLRGAITPTVRQSYTQLDETTYAIAVGDAHVHMDPVIGQGGNAASFAAFMLGETILEGGALDEEFCKRVDERRLPLVLGSFDFTNFMLRPEPHLLDVIGAMSQNPALSDDFTEGFTDPPRQWQNLHSAENTAAYLGSFASATVGSSS
jgi:2-polyprenyl-6-methoxyphenol hydroxylase-like FAD-dependent oxidoreductase